MWFNKEVFYSATDSNMLSQRPISIPVPCNACVKIRKMYILWADTGSHQVSVAWRVEQGLNISCHLFPASGTFVTCTECVTLCSGFG